MIEVFDKDQLKQLYIPDPDSSGEDNGQIIIIGGSRLFHGAPLLSLKVASRVVDMVFFATPEKSVGEVAEKMKSKLLSFIWVPWEETEEYIEKSDAILIGPGFMRFSSEKIPHGARHHYCDDVCERTREITKKFLDKYSNKKWVIDAGSLQTMEASWIPKGSIITPNKKEFECLFGKMSPQKAAKEYSCTIIAKAAKALVCDGDRCVESSNGNPGLTKGGIGDVLAGLTAALFAKNGAFLAASSASYILKETADDLSKEKGFGFNADDLAEKIPFTLKRLTS